MGDAVIEWLLDSDPAVRWQVERDLLGAPEPVWRATRARVATEGFGARLLALQDESGTWAGGAHFPKDFTGDEPGQPWTATSWSLNALREWGADAVALGDTAARLAANARWEYDDLPFWGGEVDCCINAFTLANGVWLGADVDALAAWFPEHRLADGGWNCDWVEGSARSSFHSTLNSLEGLLAYDEATGGTDTTRAARRGGEEYLLSRDLFRRASTGEPVAAWVHRFVYPPRHRYSVLKALEYFRRAAALDSREPDQRMAQAVEMVRAARGPDGRWPAGEQLPGRVWFDVEAPAGEPSRWLTLSAMRVLAWWDGQTA